MESIFVNNTFIINQNTNIYGQFINEGTYDYTFNINLAPLVTDMTFLFANATYIQNTQDVNNYNINLTILDTASIIGNSDATWASAINNQNIINLEIGSSSVGFSTLNPAVSECFGERLLEVVAHKIFGHGKAHAAISNDSAFFTHDASLWDHLVASVANDTFRHEIFNQYVSSGRYQRYITEQLANNNNDITNDVNTFINFNFSNLSIDFPMYLAGNILLNNTLTANEINLFMNGPNVGGTLLANGVYNVPILIKLHT